MTSKYGRFAILLGFVLAIAVGLSACGGGGSLSSESTSTSEATSEGGSAANSEAVSSDDGVAAAKKAITPYIGQPSPFPVTEPLTKSLPPGKKVVDVQCGTPYCALIAELLKGPTAALQMSFTPIKAGASASAVGAAFDSALSQEPDGLVTGGIDIELFQNQLKELLEKEVPIASIGLIHNKEYGLNPAVDSELEFERDGMLMANYVIAEYGPESNIVWYDVPELPFTGIEEAAFNETIAQNCPGCEVRKAEIGVETIGNTAPSQIVSDLQANPETNVAVFSIDEAQTGLPSALKAAGITIKTMGLSPDPTNLQYLKEGKETAALAQDAPVQAWSAIDEIARQINGQKLTKDEAKGLGDIQFLTQKDITFDTSKGWTGYPDVAERFEKLWGVGG